MAIRKNFPKMDLFNIISALGVFVLSSLVITKVSFSSELRRWIGIIFFCALYFSGIYEIPIKEGIKAGYTKNQIACEIVIVWVIPLMLGYGLSHYLIVTGQIGR